MVNALFFLAVTSTSMWCFAPRFFRVCDAALVRQRFHTHQRQIKQIRRPSTKDRPSATRHEFLPPRQFNELARLTRAHVPLRDAIHLITTDTSSEIWQTFVNDASHQETFEPGYVGAYRALHNDLSYHLLMASISDGVFLPMALDEAARLLREQQRMNGDIEIAAAQARLTMKVLTRAPLLLLAILMMMSDSFRCAIASPGIIIVIVFALALNRIGATWSAHLVRRLMSSSVVDEILNVTSVLSVHLRAGHSLPSACLRLSHVNTLGRSITQALLDRQTFEDAMQPLREHKHLFGQDLASILTTAYRDGQPAVEIISIVTNEARQLRDQQNQIQIRKLPSQLSAPVVLCALPAFILLIVVPMFVSQLSALSGALHISPS